MSRFWDNLVPLRSSLSGEQLAGWKPDRVAMRGLGCRLLADQRVPVGDGISLSADVYVPKAQGRYPAIVQFAAYSRELHTAAVPTGCNEIGSPAVLADRGYAQVVVTRRGMGRSNGSAGVFFNPQDVDDHERCIAWAAEQPWCNGDVVLFGTSYYGMTQLLVAIRRPPALKAFFCVEVCTDYFRHLVQFGGVFALYFVTLWVGSNFSQSFYRLRMPPIVRALINQIMNSPLKSLGGRAFSAYRSFMSKMPIKPVREWYVNWMIDGKTRQSNCIPPGPYRELGKIEIPFVVVQNLGYFNLHQFGSYDLFENAGTQADRKWLILGPPRHHLPVYEWQLEALAFFDHILRAADNGYGIQPAVRYWLDGDERYKCATSFPVPGSEPVRFHLDTRGADDAVHALTSEPPAFGANSWAAIPLGAPIIAGIDEVLNQKLVYETTIGTDTEFAGPVSAHLRFSCNEIDSYVVARLGRVDAAGAYHLLSMGAISPARRRPDSDRSTACEIAIDTETPTPLTPGETVSLMFSLTPAPTRLRPGEKLRFEIASRTDLLKSDFAHGYVHFNIPGPPYFSRNKLHYGSESYLELYRVP
jgi:uncharacterized protein